MMGRLRWARAGAVLALLTGSAAVRAQGAAAPVDSGDTAWIIVASALVLFMTLPGLGMFYGGLVRAKNFLSILMQCFAITALVSVMWFAGGYSLAFATGTPWSGPAVFPLEPANQPSTAPGCAVAASSASIRSRASPRAAARPCMAASRSGRRARLIR